MDSLLIAGKTICLPFESEEHYSMCLKNREAFRGFLAEMHTKHTELFPRNMGEGFIFKGFTNSTKQDGFAMRRIKLRDGKIYQVRPSFMMPYMIAKTEEVEKGLYLRRWNVPFHALTYVFGHDDMFWYRAEISIGRNSVVGTTVKDPALMPEHLLADEKHTRINGEKAYVTTVVAKECILGVGLAENPGTEALTRGYSHFKEEATNLAPDYKPLTFNTDGWEATRNALKALFPGVTLILCFLHAYLKIRDRCKRQMELFLTVKEKVWNVYKASTPSQFSQRIRRLKEWVVNLAEGPVKEKVLDLCAKASEFKKALDHPGAYRTSNALDRLMNHQDRLLYSMLYFHGTSVSALLRLRSMALIWNFHPYCSRARHKDLHFRATPFEELNGFHYHSNWLQNMLVAASLGGWKT